MKNFYKMEEVDITSIVPLGWLQEFLKRQMDGLTGHLYQTAYPFNKVRWDNANKLTEDGYSLCADDCFNDIGWWGYEQVAYYLDGYEKTATLLGIDDNKNKIINQLRNTLNITDEDGYIGPVFLKENNANQRWPHTVLFRAVMTLYNKTKDKKIIDILLKHYLNDNIVYDEFRNVTNIEIMLWLYSITAEKKLLEKSINDYNAYKEKAKTDEHNGYVKFDKNKPYNHGVTYNEIAKLGAILYSFTGNEEYLKESINSYKKIDKYFKLPSGCLCSNEFMISNNYYQCSEMCDVSDYTWSLGYLLMATGDGRYADYIEKCIFNAGIGAVMEDFSAMQYFSCANQVLATENSCHNFFKFGGEWMQYRAVSEVQCCLGNCNRFMPNYISRMFMKKNDDIYVCLFGESKYVDDKIEIIEKTDYPFDDDISFILKKWNSGNLYIRIPIWTNKFRLTLNDKDVDYKVINNFALVCDKIKSNDVLKLTLESKIKTKKNGNGVFFTKGALVYSIGDKGERESVFDNENKFLGYNMRIKSKWNYGVSTNAIPNFIEKKASGFFWDADFCPYTIEVDAIEIKNWGNKILKNKKVKDVWNLYDKLFVYKKGDFEITPRLPSKKEINENCLKKTTKIKLVPYGVAKMRMTVLPIINNQSK